MKTNKFGEALMFFLSEFAASDAEMLEDGCMEVYGEDDQGREGSCEVTVNDLAQAAIDEIKHLREQLAKANEIISECWRLVGNDVDSKSALPESVNSLNERVNELEEENGLMMTRLMAAALGLASGKSCPTAIEELNKFAIEQKRIGYYDSCIKSGLNEGQASLLSDIYACFAKGVSRD